MICLGILWNGMQEHLDDVMKDISLHGKVIKSFSMNLGYDYETFVRDIYSQDEIAEWKVDKKVETMFECSDIRSVTIVFIDIETAEIQYHPYKKRKVFVSLENMKTSIRTKYSQIVTHYFFDNVFHVTDNEVEYEADLKIVSEYYNRLNGQNKGNMPKPNIKVRSNKVPNGTTE